jgi:hypothetical protein
MIPLALVTMVSAGPPGVLANPIDQLLTIVKDIQTKLDTFIRSTGSSLNDIHGDIASLCTLAGNIKGDTDIIHGDVQSLKMTPCTWHDVWILKEGIAGNVNIELRNFGPTEETVEYPVTGEGGRSRATSGLDYPE